MEPVGTIRTSRVGRKPVLIPSNVEIKIKDKELTAKGPKGQLSLLLHDLVQVEIDDKSIYVKLNDNTDQVITGPSNKLCRSITGTVRANINNVIQGVTHGFERKLALVGVGFRAQTKGNVLSLSLGFSHPTEFRIPAGVTIETPSQTEIVIKGTSKELVGLVAAKIRSIRCPEPYKGKGVRYANEIIEIKETKKK